MPRTFLRMSSRKKVEGGAVPDAILCYVYEQSRPILGAAVLQVYPEDAVAGIAERLRFGEAVERALDRALGP